MPYSADISRNNPGCFLFLIDQSYSMTEALGAQPGMRKMDQAADTINRTLDAISQRCSQGMEIRDYFDIGIIGYKTNALGNGIVRSLLDGSSISHPFRTISQVVDTAEVEEREVKESDGAGGLVTYSRRFPVWLHAEAEYGTPMCEALYQAATAVRQWATDHPTSYPPIVINISDGMASDGDPEPFAQNIMETTTDDGDSLIFNCHLSQSSGIPCQFPAEESELPDDDFAKQLFRMSSPLPETCIQLAAALDLPVRDGSRGFVFNANLEALVQFLDIGTRGTTSIELH